MPAEIVTIAVAMLPDTLTKLLDLRDQLFTRHLFEVSVHDEKPAGYSSSVRMLPVDARPFRDPLAIEARS
jgi:hypothetical protein